MVRCPHCGSTAQAKILDVEELLSSSSYSICLTDKIFS